jgi:hypothetical protein
LPTRIRGDFNGLFGDLLCISHSATAVTESGEEITLVPGLELVAYEDDIEDGKPMFLVARGDVISSPPELQCYGSTWSLRINDAGVRHVESLDDA